MKISEMTNAQATDAMIRLSGPLSEICDDEEAVKIVDEYKARYNKPFFYAVGKLIPALVSHLLVKHMRAVYEIVSIFAEKPIEQVADMKLTETIEILRNSYDDVLRSFFPSSGGSTRNAGKG